MRKKFSLIFIFFCFLVISNFTGAVDIIGGEITWQCQGNGDFIFELKLYRDCNGVVANNNETLDVWRHPNLTSIPLFLISKTDISPTCTPNSGNNPITCGTGNNSGSGLGAMEEIIYQSNLISIPGTPPNTGWEFTYHNSSIGSNITNIQNSVSAGITLVSTMFAVPSTNGSNGWDSSPTFLQTPRPISCTKEYYNINFNAVDEDLDSLVYSWSAPLDDYISGGYNPPVTPAPLTFASGFSISQPTPGPAFNANNIHASLNAATGEIQFKSHTVGIFLAKIKVDSYRKGVKISTVEKQFQFIINNCGNTNIAPDIIPPFDNNNFFDTTIFAGDAVHFNLKATDFDNLQDGTPQSVTISASGLIFGNNFTDSNNGCIIPPCATLNQPIITANNSADLSFDWQTSCDHLIGTSNEAQNEIPYTFVFKVQDNICPIPIVKYATVTINLKNKDILPPPGIECVSTDAAGNVSIDWNPVSDPFGTFFGYEISGVNNGIYDTVKIMNQGNYLYTTGMTASDDFYVTTLSGCDGNTKRNSDTLSSIFLSLVNSNNGEAGLNWNQPGPVQLNNFGSYFYIYKEYPAGIWTFLDSVPYNQTQYIDTITVCEAYIRYRVELPSTGCNFISNVAGDTFKDKIVPNIPVISAIDIDTLSGEISISWNENQQPDTYGYVVYQKNSKGFFVEIDTIWGKSNTNYSIFLNPEEGPYQFSIAAFDSCYTTNIPPTYQTSAKANPHTTNFLTTNLDVCSNIVQLNWTGYKGFNAILKYIIYAQINGGGWKVIDETNDNTYDMSIDAGDDILLVVQAVSTDSSTSFSNIDTMAFVGAKNPEMSYLSVATVVNKTVQVKHRVSLNSNLKWVELERLNPYYQEFEKIDQQEITNSDEIVFVDKDVETNKFSYTYRTRVVDTCGQNYAYSNIGKTMLLNVITNEEEESHTLQWTPYEDFHGNLFRYEIYKGYDENSFYPTPIAILPPEKRTFNDTTAAQGEYNQGKNCYIIMAREGNSEYGYEEISYSNVACATLTPLVYIPNAFTVNGLNPIFKPETTLHEFARYSFKIYDRFGRIIFSTDDPNVGWDGMNKKGSRYVEEGVYLYRLSLRDGNGREVLKHGHVTLIGGM